MQTVLALGLLVVVLAFVLARPSQLPEAAVAVPAAGAAIALGVVPLDAAWDQVQALAPTVGFLAAVLVLAHLADAGGVFTYAGGLAAVLSRGSPRRLLGAVFLVAAIVTAVLSLDATVVLLTPVVFLTATRLGMRSGPPTYACTHLANSASVLLPVSNLTNLLAFSAAGLTFTGFSAVMALPWVSVIAVEYLVFRRFFASDLAAPSQPVPPVQMRAPRFALVVLGLTVAGFAAAEPVGFHPAWAAVAGAVTLAMPQMVRAPRNGWRIARETNPPFCLFVFALGIVVLGVRLNGLGELIDRLVPTTASLGSLLALALLAAVLANLVNNLPATLLLVPAVHGPGPVLAVLIGVNVGPNLTYVGSLATLLWRQILHRQGAAPATGEFLRLGAITVPLCLVAGVVALWLGLAVSGTS